MNTYFITARSFAAPFCSDTSEKYVEALDSADALVRFAAGYSHPCGLYAAECWNSADHAHGAPGQPKEPLARWESNHLQAVTEATKGKSSYSYMGSGPGKFEIGKEKYSVPNPTGGSVVA